MHTRFSEVTATVVISGELDIAVVSELQRALREVLNRRPERLVLDLAGVTFIDCASARVLATASRALPRARKAVICRPSRVVDRMLQLTGMSAYFWIERPIPGVSHRARPPRPGHSHEVRAAVLAARLSLPRRVPLRCHAELSRSDSGS